MRDVPIGYEQAIAPGQITVNRYAELRRFNDLTQPPEYFGVPIIGGSVTTESVSSPGGGGFSQTNARLTLLDEDDRFDLAASRLTPDANNIGPTAPYGTTLRVNYGVKIPGSGYVGFFGDDTFWTVSGTMRIGQNTDEGDGRLDVPCYDFSRHISRSRFEAPYVIGAGQSYVLAIMAGVDSRRTPNMYTDWIAVDSGDLTPLIVIDPEQDPWAEFQAMAAAIGYVLYFNLEGRPVLLPRPDPSTDIPVRNFVHGVDAIVAMPRDLSDDPGYNGVLMRSDSSVLSVPLQSVAWDTDPDSPTYYLGPYGKIPFPTSSPYIANQTQCDAAARSALVSVLGITERVTVSCLPDPALRVNDVVYCYRERRGVPIIDGNYVVDSITLPLSLTEPMVVQSRRQRSGL